MHPILFRIPLPTRAVPLFTLLLIIAGVFALVTLIQLYQRNKSSAIMYGIIGGTLAAAAFRFQGETWNMGPLPIYSYGVMLGISFVVGWYLSLGLAEKIGLPQETMANNFVITAVSALAGSRILYVLTNLSEFDSFWSIFAIRSGGLVAYGGFLGGFIGSYAYLSKYKIPLLPWADAAVPSLATGLMITRIGCYLFGCDFGRPLSESAPAWLKKAGSFPHWAEGLVDKGTGSPAWVQHVRDRGLPQTAEFSLPVHPTQLYESLVGLSLFIFLMLMRKHQKFRGQIFLLFTFSYGICRYLLEIVRDDSERGSIPLSLPEHILVPLGLVILAIGYAIGFSQWISNITVRRITQVLAFVPATLLFFAMKPDAFALTTSVQWSTSQFVAITTGFAASAGFAILYKAALAHPDTAMALNLPLATEPNANLADADEDIPEQSSKEKESPKNSDGENEKT